MNEGIFSLVKRTDFANNYVYLQQFSIRSTTYIYIMNDDTSKTLDPKDEETTSLEKNYLYDFQMHMDELRDNNNPEKKEIVTQYEELVLKGEKISGDVKDQKWYKEYVVRFKPLKYKVPEDLVEDFDWDLLFQLITSSFSSIYRLEAADVTSDPELIVSVTSGDKTIEKKISELWSFQIIRLFEIYSEEQINLEKVRAEGVEDKYNLATERRKHIREYLHKYKKQIEKETKQSEKDDSQDPYSLVYHYCSLESAFNIIKNQSMFASDLRFMNDKEEIQYGREVLKKVIKKIADESDAEEEDTINQLIKDIDSKLPQEPIYAICFSKKRDDLNQWRAYANNGAGICLAISLIEPEEDTMESSETDTQELSEKKTNEEMPYETQFYYDKIYYVDKNSDLKTEDDWNKVSGNHIEESLEDFLLEQEESDQIPEFPNYLKRMVAFYKNIKFEEEEEIRLLSLNNDIDSEGKPVKQKVETRYSNGFIIPYLVHSLKNKNGSSNIKEVIIGPSVKDKERLEKSIRTFLDICGLQAVKISFSDIPYAP